MGRLATQVAAAFADVGELPAGKKLPEISFLDTLLPYKPKSRNTPQPKKPVDPNVGMRVQREFYDIKKDKNGKKMVVAHKTSEGGKKGEQADEKGKDNGGNKGGKDNGGKAEEGGEKNNDGGNQDKGGSREWTAEQDAKIIALKEATDKSWSWAEIGNEVGGKGKNEVRARYNELKKNSNEGNAAKDDKKSEGDKQKKNENGEGGGKGGKGVGDHAQKQHNKDKNKDKAEDKAAAKPPSKAPSKTGSEAGKGGEARFTMGEWRTLQEDDLFSFGELQCLSELMLRDQQQRWLRIASAFCDTTGRRVHPEDIRDKFEEMQGMN